MSEETPSVLVKRKNIQGLIDYSLENKIEIKIKPRIANSDEFEVDFNISSVKKAIALGMCLKELRLELLGAPAPAVVNKSAKKQIPKDNGNAKEELVTPVSFAGEENFQLDLETAN